jgi:ATP-dependent DNA ligase
MLARLARDLPGNGYLYEPKWDGLRGLVMRSGSDVVIGSRHRRQLTRYFPELVEAFQSLDTERFIVDGEIVIVRPHGFDFEALLTRIHPAASRVARLRGETPASFVAFDAPGVEATDLCERPFHERRGWLERLLEAARPPLYLTPITADIGLARQWLTRFHGGGIDGVVAKHRDLPYRPGERAMIKVKPERTADCVVAGFRVYAGEPVVASLLLGLYDRDELRHVGVVASFPEQRRRELFDDLSAIAIPIGHHPWKDGFAIGTSPVSRLRGAAGRWTPAAPVDWTAVRPERVCEVAYDQVDAGRFRHPARFRRWRPDREPRSCTVEQLAVSAGPTEEMLA